MRLPFSLIRWGRACALGLLFTTLMLGPYASFNAVRANGYDLKRLPGIVLDDSQAKLTGKWSPSTHTQPYAGAGYVHSGLPNDPDSKEPKSVLFTAKVDQLGEHEVFVGYNSGGNRAAKAPVTITHAEGDTSIRVNQRKAPEVHGILHSVGKFLFDPEREVKIEFGNQDADGIVIVDSVVLVPVEMAVALRSQTKQLASKGPGDKSAAPADQVAPEFARGEIPASARKLDPKSLDALIVEQAHVTNPTGLVDDATFLRRITIDLIGRIPSEEELATFLEDSSEDKRVVAIDRLLDSPDFGRNWASYWSDVFSYRIPQPELTYLSYDTFKGWLAEQLNSETGWDEVSYRILTATGKVKENPAAMFVGFHQADRSRLAGETTRIFLGTQIQCAECHDHPFVDIPQERFHEMAAFFVRSGAKLPWNDSDLIEVTSKPAGEHKLAEKNKVMMPTVFDGKPLEAGASDIDRRTSLARWVVDHDNPLFARAFANRMWERLMDRPFCDPVDEISDEAGYPTVPKIHQAVADHFVASEYNPKAMFRLIMNTEAYQREINPDENTRGQLAASEPKKMRGEVVFWSLATAIDLPNLQGVQEEASGAQRFPPPPKSTMDKVNEAFGYDPSLGKDFRPQTMQQAMFLMNNVEVDAQLKADPTHETKLAKILQETKDDRQAVERLFRSVLARPATEEEVRIGLEFVSEVNDRAEAFEDLLWALLNSAEFTTRN